MNYVFYNIGVKVGQHDSENLKPYKNELRFNLAYAN